jgi:hypothetical protein
MTGPTDVSKSACWGRQIISAIPCLDDPSEVGENSPMPRMRAVTACADVGGVESPWANEKTLPCRGSVLGILGTPNNGVIHFGG